MSNWYPTHAVIPIVALALDIASVPITGLTNLYISIRRTSDDMWLDFSDHTFKPAGWVVRQTPMEEISASLAPGLYRHRFDTDNYAPDTYCTTVQQIPPTVFTQTLVDELSVGTAGYLTTEEVTASVWDSTQGASVINNITQLGVDIAGIPAAAAAQVWDALQADYHATGSFGDLVRRIVALQKENYFIDNTTYNSRGVMLTGRMRIFANQAGVATATAGGTGQGEIGTYQFTTTTAAGHPELAATVRSVHTS